MLHLIAYCIYSLFETTVGFSETLSRCVFYRSRKVCSLGRENQKRAKFWSFSNVKVNVEDKLSLNSRKKIGIICLLAYFFLKCVLRCT